MSLESDTLRLMNLIKSQRIVIFGAGIGGHDCRTDLHCSGGQFSRYIDSSIQKETMQNFGNCIAVNPKNFIKADDEIVIIASSKYHFEMRSILNNLGLKLYEDYFYYWDKSVQLAFSEIGARRLQREYQTTGKIPLFEYVEIETVNRCNNDCSFCPVNKNNDP